MPDTPSGGDQRQSAVVYPAALDNIDKYDGHENVKEFLSVIDNTGRLYNWTDSQKVDVCRIKLRGNARIYLESEVQLQSTQDWNLFKKQLTEKFTIKKTPAQCLREFYNCSQRRNEKVVDYLARLKIAGSKTMDLPTGETDRAAVQKQYDAHLLVRFMDGLIEPIRSIVALARPSKLSTALEVAQDAECNQTWTQRQGHPLMMAVFNREEDEVRRFPLRNERRPTECAQTNSRSRRSTITCYNCNGQGHIARVCPSAKSRQQHLNSKPAPSTPRGGAQY